MSVILTKDTIIILKYFNANRNSSIRQDCDMSGATRDGRGKGRDVAAIIDVHFKLTQRLQGWPRLRQPIPV